MSTSAQKMSTEFMRSVTLSSIHCGGQTGEGTEGMVMLSGNSAGRSYPGLFHCPVTPANLDQYWNQAVKFSCGFLPVWQQLISEFDFSCLLWRCCTGIWYGHGSLGLFMEVSSLKWPEMKINDGWGFSHLHKAIVCGENSWVLGAPHGPVTSIPKAQLFAKCLQTCVIFKELEPDFPWLVSYVWAKESWLLKGGSSPVLWRAVE